MCTYSPLRSSLRLIEGPQTKQRSLAARRLTRPVCGRGPGGRWEETRRSQTGGYKSDHPGGSPPPSTHFIRRFPPSTVLRGCSKQWVKQRRKHWSCKFTDGGSRLKRRSEPDPLAHRDHSDCDSL
ncbi:hypothetical protein Q5P01_015769 [Channa striata]|uniref:Uncharacterized protein n=1 Tax=Channa striata TaxID=64152 RepID=A0AA88SEY0_CHASR|nr:hypothetical protein Q5P01_015769 [Channa striata]